MPGADGRSSSRWHNRPCGRSPRRLFRSGCWGAAHLPDAVVVLLHGVSARGHITTRQIMHRDGLPGPTRGSQEGVTRPPLPVAPIQGSVRSWTRCTPHHLTRTTASTTSRASPKIDASRSPVPGPPPGAPCMRCLMKTPSAAETLRPGSSCMCSGPESGVRPGRVRLFLRGCQPASGHCSVGGGGSGSFRSVWRAFSPLRAVSHGHRSGSDCAGQARRCSMRQRWNWSGGPTP